VILRMLAALVDAQPPLTFYGWHSQVISAVQLTAKTPERPGTGLQFGATRTVDFSLSRWHEEPSIGFSESSSLFINPHARSQLLRASLRASAQSWRSVFLTFEPLQSVSVI
jgi:hypothetical protein